MMRKITILSNIFLVLTIANGQIPNLTDQKIVDSLFILLPDAEGTAKIDILNQIALQIAPRSFDSSFQYATDALSLSEKMNYPKGKGIATFNLGNSFYFKADTKNALINYLNAVRMLEPFEPCREIGDLLVQLGALNQYVRNTEKVYDYYQRAARNFIEIGDSTATMWVYMMLSISYYYKVQTLWQIDTLTTKEKNTMMDSAIKYNDFALDYYLHSKPDYQWMCVDAWLANIYIYHMAFYGVKGDSLALYYGLKALEASKADKDTNHRNFLEGAIYTNLGGHYYFAKENHDIGYKYTKIGAKLLKKTDRYDMYSFSLSIIGEMEWDKGRFKVSKRILNQALDASDTFLLKVGQTVIHDPTFRLWGVTQLRSFRASIFRDLVQLYESTGDLNNALLYEKKLEEENRIQTLDELNRQIMGLQVNNENDMRKEQLNSLAKENDINKMKLLHTRSILIGFAGFALLAGLILILIYQRKKLKSDQKALILEQKLLRAQMNPHFLFNSLTSIQNFIVAEKPDKASVYLSKFSKLVRNILDNSVEEYVSLEREISTIENYIELQKVRYAGKFDYRIKIDPGIDDESFMIPPMLAQPFIENAIEHGVKHRETKGHIDIRFTRKDHAVIFEVEDNGVGREKAKEFESLSSEGHRSMATSITRERLDLMSRKMKQPYHLEFEDPRNEKGIVIGTKVKFAMPFQIIE